MNFGRVLDQYGFILVTALSFSACTSSDQVPIVPSEPSAARSPAIGQLTNPSELPVAGTDWLTPERAARFAQQRETGRSLQLKARMERVALRGDLSIAVSEHQLPMGVSAIVHLNAKGALSRFVVMSASRLDAAVYLRAITQAFAYEMENELDRSPTVLTIYEDGRTGQQSAARGSQTVKRWEASSVPDRVLLNQDLQRELKAAPQTDLPGMGRAKVIRR